MIQVVKHGKPVSGVSVHVSWKGGGHSAGRTDSNGVFNTGTGKGTVNYVSIDGNDYLNNMQLEDRTHQVNVS